MAVTLAFGSQLGFAWKGVCRFSSATMRSDAHLPFAYENMVSFSLVGSKGDSALLDCFFFLGGGGGGRNCKGK